MLWRQTPGEIRIRSPDVLKEAIREGVKRGLFRIGVLEDCKPVCKADSSPEFGDKEIIIRADRAEVHQSKSMRECSDGKIQFEGKDKTNELAPIYFPTSDREDKAKKGDETVKKYHGINLKLNVPTGQLSTIVKITNYLAKQFNNITITIQFSAQDGEITISDYEDKVKEALNQAGIVIEHEDTE